MNVTGERLRQLRENIRYTQREVAETLGISPSTLGMYEAGKRGIDTETLSALAKYYNVTADYLLGHTDVAVPLKDSESDISGLTATRKADIKQKLQNAEYTKHDITVIMSILERLAPKQDK